MTLSGGPESSVLAEAPRGTSAGEPDSPTRAPLSVVIPAFNEERVIERCLRALLRGAEPFELDVIVACNGCTDRTAEIARSVEGPIRVIETKEASKVAALNLGDEAAMHFPRFYVDADVVLEMPALRALAVALEQDGVLAVSPRMDMDLEQSSWAVRAFYRVWSRLPYTREGMIGVGSYGLSRLGRDRFESFPKFFLESPL